MRLTTIERTGRRMNRSQKISWDWKRQRPAPRQELSGLGASSAGGARALFTVTDFAVAELEQPRGDDLVPGLHAVRHDDKITARLAQPHKLLVDRLDAAWPVAASFASASTNTEFPYGA